MGDLIDGGDVTRLSGMPASTLHYYERRGLITAVGRHGLRRQYAPDVIDRLAVIALCQRAGFNLDEIDDLLATSGAPAWKDLVRVKLADIRSRIEAMLEIEQGLEHVLQCKSENIMRCEHFRGALHAALPVEPNDRTKR
jgi:DNA-binding transcriptional MerR regulator